MDLSRPGTVVLVHGESVTISRAGQSNITAKAKRKGAAVADTVNGQDGTRVTFIVGPTELAASAWPAPYQRADVVTDADGTARVVEAVEPKRDGDTVALYLVQAFG